MGWLGKQRSLCNDLAAKKGRHQITGHEEKHAARGLRLRRAWVDGTMGWLVLKRNLMRGEGVRRGEYDATE